MSYKDSLLLKKIKSYFNQIYLVESIKLTLLIVMGIDPMVSLLKICYQ